MQLKSAMSHDHTSSVMTIPAVLVDVITEDTQFVKGKETDRSGKKHGGAEEGWRKLHTGLKRHWEGQWKPSTDLRSPWQD